MKKIGVIFLTIVIVLFLVGCKKRPKETDQAKMDRIHDALTIVYQNNENKDGVTKDIQLKTSIESVQIVWESSNQSSISIRGIVTQKIDDVDVELTANLAYKGLNKTKTFEVKVLANSTRLDVDTVKDNLNIIFSGEDTIHQVSKNITLPTNINNVLISWTTSHPNVISNLGIVNRQSNDVNVTLNALISKEEYQLEKTFVLTVLKKEDTPLEKVDKALNALNIIFLDDDNDESVENDVVLQTNIDGVVISWGSSDIDVVNTDGLVNQQKENRTITLTATLTYLDVTKTKTFSIVVIRSEQLFYEDLILQSLTEDLITLNDGETLSTIKSSIILASNIDDITLEWTSDFEEVINNDGTVMPYVVDTIVRLTVKGSYLGFEQSKTFELIVLSDVTTIDEALTKEVDETVIIFIKVAIASTDGKLGYGEDESGIILLKSDIEEQLFTSQLIYAKGLIKETDNKKWLFVEQIWEDEQGSMVEPTIITELLPVYENHLISVIGEIEVTTIIENEEYELLINGFTFLVKISQDILESEIEQIVLLLESAEDDQIGITAYVLSDGVDLYLSLINPNQIFIDTGDL